MVRDDLRVSIPSLFKCPISLDVMNSPVSLCTGVTYDRSSIQRWLDSGHNTCPATMQQLQTKEIVPNHTLKRLIKIWSDSVQTQSNSLTQLQVRSLVNELKLTYCEVDENLFVIVDKLTSFASESNQNSKFLSKIDGFLEFLIELFNKHLKKFYFAEKIVQLFSILLEEAEDRHKLSKSIDKREFLVSISIILQHGASDSKIAAIRSLELLAIDLDSNILSELIKILRENTKPDSLIDSCLSCLISSLINKRIRIKFVHLGAVETLGKLLSESNVSVSIIEKTMKILEMLTACKEGRKAICENEACLNAIVKNLLKVSSPATEHGVTILWSLCCLFRESKAQAGVVQSNGLTKLLLLMQSNCSHAVRQMSSDMLKMFRVNSKSCLISYETKTTHIMPF
ncbi:U-box domain-containing protein 27-like [Apium graveolens]|uniref:U-box domain-containing protein 27-like n=1 Tax=Apium graveolens TaxID=4045 RepID=UPI003D79000F